MHFGQSENKKKLPNGSGSVDVVSFKLYNIFTRQDRQLRMRGSCHVDKF